MAGAWGECVSIGDQRTSGLTAEARQTGAALPPASEDANPAYTLALTLDSLLSELRGNASGFKPFWLMLFCY